MERISELTKNALMREIPILTAEIRALYQELDRKYKLHSSRVPITFGLEEDTLGSYTPGGREKKEQFRFSLLFVGYGVEKPLSKEDRRDLFLHEYAHYMQYSLKDIPDEYCFEQGIHGSAWRYCCSLIGAAPTPYYRAGEALLAHDYEKSLKNPWKDPFAAQKDIRRREKNYEAQRNRVVCFEVGDEVTHPKFGTGTVQSVQQLEASVRLRILFGEEEKLIDQKWLLRSRYRKQG